MKKSILQPFQPVVLGLTTSDNQQSISFQAANNAVESNIKTQSRKRECGEYNTYDDETSKKRRIFH